MPRAMVLCAGFGTRLRPLTEELPKPLVPIGDRPLLAHIAARLEAAGISEMVLNTHHLSEQYRNYLAEMPIKTQVIHEPEIRGTAGGVHGASVLLGSAPILVWNGDILAEPPIAELFGQVGDGLCLCVARRAPGEGTLGVGSDGSVARLRGERFGSEAYGADYIGVAAVGARCLDELPERGCLIGDVALPELRAGRKLPTVETKQAWSDIGDVSAYLRANLIWLQERGLNAWADPSADVAASVQLRATVVGKGATIDGQGILENCVIWPGAPVAAPLSDAIVLTSGRVVPVQDLARSKC